MCTWIEPHIQDDTDMKGVLGQARPTRRAGLGEIIPLGPQTIVRVSAIDIWRIAGERKLSIVHV